MIRSLRGYVEKALGRPGKVAPAPGEEAPGKETATRATLTDAWQKAQGKIDWMAAPAMADYVNGMVSGRPVGDNGHWAIHARDHFVAPLNSRLGGKVSMASLACGSGHIEETLFRDFHWPVTEFLGLEFDDQLRASAAERFARITTCRSRFEFFDFNAGEIPDRRFDIVFTCHSIHHATDVEALMEKMNRMLAPGGLIIGIDFFGPTRFQIEHDVLPIIEELFSYLSPDLRRNLSTPDMTVQDSFVHGTIEEVRSADPSESIRSSDLRTLLFSTFPVIEIKPMGGTLLRWLLQNRAGNFDPENPDHVAIMRCLQFIERELIALRRIKSDDLFFVLGKSGRVKG